MSSEIKELVTIEEVCEMLKLHPSTVYRLTRERKLPGYRINGAVRYNLQEVWDALKKTQVVEDAK